MATGVNFGVQQYFAFDPRSLPDCAMWLDGADSNAMTLSGSSVTRWRDKSGNARDAVSQTTAATLASNVSPGIPYLNMVGTSSYLVTYSSFPNSAYTIFTAQYATSSTGYQRVIHGAPTSNAYLFVGTSNAFAAAFTGTGGTSWNDVAGTSISNLNQWQIVCANVSGTSLATHITGTSAGTKTGTTGSFSNLLIGTDNANTQPFNGNVGEIIIYSRSITDVERQQVEGYLAWKWGRNSILPTGHPYLYNPTYSRLFQPPDINGLILWLDSTDQSPKSMTLSGTTISNWLDKSGNGSNFSSSASPAGSAPVIGTLSNLPIVDTTAGGCFTNGSSSVPITYSGFTTGYSTITAAANTWSGLFYGTPDAIFMLRAFQAQMFLWKGDGGIWGNPSVATGPTTTSNTLWSFTNPTAAGPSYLWVNGTLNQSNTGRTNPATTGLDIGRWVNNTMPWKGYIGDVIFYDSGLSDPERQRVEGFLAWKMGLRSSLPTTHPFYNFAPHTPAFHPMILSNSTLWLDGADSTSNSMTFSGSNITVWKDKSSNGKNFTASGTGATLGSNGGLVFTTNLYTSTHSAVVTNETIFVVCQYTQAGQGMMVGASARSGREVAIYNTNNQAGIINALNAWGALSPSGSVSPSNTFLITGIISSGSNTQIAVKGANTFTSSNVSPFTFSNGTTQLGQEGGGGATYQFSGTLNEVIAYSRVLTSNERRKVEGWLSWKWGIQKDMSTNHPFFPFRP